jgi:hypothetical protein
VAEIKVPSLPQASSDTTLVEVGASLWTSESESLGIPFGPSLSEWGEPQKHLPGESVTWLLLLYFSAILKLLQMGTI